MSKGDKIKILESNMLQQADHMMKQANKIYELEIDKTELIKCLREISSYNFNDLDWSEARNIRDYIDNILEKIK